MNGPSAVAEAILFPDPIIVCRDWLVPRLAPVMVAQKRPREIPPTEQVQLVRTGGARDHLVIDGGQVTVTCWAATDVRSAELANLARAHLGAMAGQTVGAAVVYAVVEVGGPYSNPDPDSWSPRHTFTVTVNVRGVAIPA